MRTIDAAKFFRARMDMDQSDLGIGDVEHGIALRRDLTEATANEHDQIGALHARKELWIDPDAQTARITGMHRIEQMPTSESRRDRERKPLDKSRQIGRRLFSPPASAV